MESECVNNAVCRTETVTRDKCQFVFEKECLPLGKEKCKNFPELLCDVVNVTKVQQQCEAVTDRQVRLCIS